MESGQAIQRISPEIKEDLKFIDVREKDWDTIYHMMIREYRKPYDLEHDPLLRFRLFKLDEDRYIIMKGVHHIISDAISTFTFIEELLAIYKALRRGDKPQLPAVRARYLDFLNWQNEFLAGRYSKRMLEYWKRHLPTEVPTLNLPTDKPRPIVQTNNGASEFFVLDPELTARIRAMLTRNRRNGVHDSAQHLLHATSPFHGTGRYHRREPGDWKDTGRVLGGVRLFRKPAPPARELGGRSIVS